MSRLNPPGKSADFDTILTSLSLELQNKGRQLSHNHLSQYDPNYRINIEAHRQALRKAQSLFRYCSSLGETMIFIDDRAMKRLRECFTHYFFYITESMNYPCDANVRVIKKLLIQFEELYRKMNETKDVHCDTEGVFTRLVGKYLQSKRVRPVNEVLRVFGASNHHFNLKSWKDRMEFFRLCAQKEKSVTVKQKESSDNTLIIISSTCHLYENSLQFTFDDNSTSSINGFPIPRLMNGKPFLIDCLKPILSLFTIQLFLLKWKDFLTFRTKIKFFIANTFTFFPRSFVFDDCFSDGSIEIWCYYSKRVPPFTIMFVSIESNMVLRYDYRLRLPQFKKLHDRFEERFSELISLSDLSAVMKIWFQVCRELYGEEDYYQNVEEVEAQRQSEENITYPTNVSQCDAFRDKVALFDRNAAFEGKYFLYDSIQTNAEDQMLSEHLRTYFEEINSTIRSPSEPNSDALMDCSSSAFPNENGQPYFPLLHRPFTPFIQLQQRSNMSENETHPNSDLQTPVESISSKNFNSVLAQKIDVSQPVEQVETRESGLENNNSSFFQPSQEIVSESENEQIDALDFQ